MSDPVIPLTDLGAQYAEIKNEIDAAIQRTIDSNQFISGPPVTAFEEAFAGLIGVNHAIGVASGTDALNLATLALGIGPGDEVVTQTNTWISTAFCISHAGARPVLVDIDPHTYQMDVNALENAITDKTKAVIPVHMFGHPAPMDDIVAICRPRGIRIIEDVAQAPLAELNGKRAGTFGDIACFSFYPSKNLGCYGDGGAIVTNDDEIASRVRQLAFYGQTKPHEHKSVGFNSRLDTLQAAIVLVKIGHLPAWTDARRDRAARYMESLADLPVTLPGEAEGAKSVYHLFVIQVDERDACLGHLHENGILAQVHYRGLIHQQPCYAELGYAAGDFPVAERYLGRILSLPLYPELTDAQIERVVDALASFHKTETV